MNEFIDNKGACCKDTCCAEGCCSDGCNTGECSNSFAMMDAVVSQ